MYKPRREPIKLELNDETARMLGTKLFTAQEIADLFGINIATFEINYGNAWRQGKLDISLSARQILERLVDELSIYDGFYIADSRVAKIALSAVELYERLYGTPKTQKIEISRTDELQNLSDDELLAKLKAAGLAPIDEKAKK